MTANKENLERLTESFLTNGLTAREQVELQALLKESEHKDYFKKMYMIWHNTHHAGDEEYVEKALQGALSKIDRRQEQQYPANGESSGWGWSNTFRNMAAAILIGFALGVATYHLAGRPGHSDSSPVAVLEASRVMVPMGSRSQVELPDGSVVTLNAGSNLHYQTSYGQGSREVWLEGEGYFKVVKNAAIPFIVKAKDVTIKALGTEFNVKAYPEEKTVQTTLVNGIVTVSQTNTADNAGEITLKPKQTITLTDQTSTIDPVRDDPVQPVASLPLIQTAEKAAPENAVLKSNIKTEIFTSWKDPRWVIESEPLSDLATKLQRRYDVQIIIADDVLKQYPFNGILTDETLEQVLDIMKTIAPINYRISKKTVTLTVNTRHKKYFDELMK